MPYGISFVWAKPFSSQISVSRSVSSAASKPPADFKYTSKTAPSSGVSIWVSPLSVCFLQDVGKATLRNLFPLNWGGLGCRDNVADCRVHFLKGVRRAAADKDVLKLRQSILIGHGVFIYCKPA